MNLPLNTEAWNPVVNRTDKYIDHTLMPPCQAACPLHMDIREYVDMVAQGKIMEAINMMETIIALKPANVEEFKTALETLRRDSLRK